MKIKIVDERIVTVSISDTGPAFESYNAVVRDGVVMSMSEITQCHKRATKETIQRYIAFCKEVLEAVEESGG